MINSERASEFCICSIKLVNLTWPVLHVTAEEKQLYPDTCQWAEAKASLWKELCLDKLLVIFLWQFGF